jgi:hypothetical protein
MEVKMTKIEERPSDKTITHRYKITEGELKRLLHLKGTITTIDLWSGLSPNDEDNKVSSDKCVWYIDTIEGNLSNDPDYNE